MAFAMTSYSLGARATLPRAAMNGNSRACVLTPRRSVRVLASQDPIDQASEKVEEVRSLCAGCAGYPHCFHDTSRC